jgi:hypothetical protein
VTICTTVNSTSTPEYYSSCFIASHFGGIRKDGGINSILSRPAQLAYEFQPRSCPTVCYFFTQTFPDLRNCYIPENPAQIEFCASRYRIYQWSTVYVYLCTRQSSRNPNYSTPETDRPQYNRPATCVIAQQYSCATFISLHFHYRKEKFVRRFKKDYDFILSLLF